MKCFFCFKKISKGVKLYKMLSSKNGIPRKDTKHPKLACSSCVPEVLGGKDEG